MIQTAFAERILAWHVECPVCGRDHRSYRQYIEEEKPWHCSKCSAPFYVKKQDGESKPAFKPKKYEGKPQRPGNVRYVSV